MEMLAVEDFIWDLRSGREVTSVQFLRREEEVVRVRDGLRAILVARRSIFDLFSFSDLVSQDQNPNQ